MSVQEIEMALRQFAPQERREIALRLLEDSKKIDPRLGASKDSGDNREYSPALPDYSARRRRIFGAKVLPNMVLAARAEEPW